MVLYNEKNIESSVHNDSAAIPGDDGSCDTTHVGLLKCCYKLAQYHSLQKFNMQHEARKKFGDTYLIKSHGKEK